MPKIRKAATVLIPSYQRKNQLERLLQYFSNSKLPFQIIILANEEEYKTFETNFFSLDLQVKIVKKSAGLVSKLYQGSKLLQTPYVCVCTDDDFFLADSLVECVNFLEKHPTYSACQGYHGLFDQNENEVFLFDFLWKSKSIESDSIMQNLSQLFQSYNPICWATFRSEVFEKIMQNLVKFEKLKGIFQELIWSTLPIIYGKIKRLPIFYCLRRSNELQHEWHPFYAFLESPQSFFRHYLKFKNFLLKKIVDKKYTRKKKRYLFDLICTKYLVFDYSRANFCFVTDSILDNPRLNLYSSAIFNRVKIEMPKMEKDRTKKVSCGPVDYYLPKEFSQQDEIITIDYISNRKLLKVFNEFFLLPIKNNSSQPTP